MAAMPGGSPSHPEAIAALRLQVCGAGPRRPVAAPGRRSNSPSASLSRFSATSVELEQPSSRIRSDSDSACALPEIARRFQLSAERGEKSLVRSDAR